MKIQLQMKQLNSVWMDFCLHVCSIDVAYLTFDLKHQHQFNRNLTIVGHMTHDNGKYTLFAIPTEIFIADRLKCKKNHNMLQVDML